METVGIEPTVFLMSLIYSQLPSPLGTHLQIEFASSSTTLLLPFPRINKLERGSVRHSEYLTSTVSVADLRSRLRVGVEPINLLLYQSFEETSIACCSLADTYKTGPLRVELNHQGLWNLFDLLVRTTFPIRLLRDNLARHVGFEPTQENPVYQGRSKPHSITSYDE